MPPVPIENYGMQSHDDIGQTETEVMDPISETEKTSRNIAAEIAALLEETPDYDDEVPDDEDEEDTLKTAPLAPVRHKRRSKTSSEEEERVRRSSCFLTEIEDQEEEEEETVQVRTSIVDFYLKKQTSVEEVQKDKQEPDYTKENYTEYVEDPIKKTYVQKEEATIIKDDKMDVETLLNDVSLSVNEDKLPEMKTVEPAIISDNLTIVEEELKNVRVENTYIELESVEDANTLVKDEQVSYLEERTHSEPARQVDNYIHVEQDMTCVLEKKTVEDNLKIVEDKLPSFSEKNTNLEPASIEDNHTFVEDELPTETNEKPSIEQTTVKEELPNVFEGMTTIESTSNEVNDSVVEEELQSVLENNSSVESLDSGDKKTVEPEMVMDKHIIVKEELSDVIKEIISMEPSVETVVKDEQRIELEEKTTVGPAIVEDKQPSVEQTLKNVREERTVDSASLEESQDNVEENTVFVEEKITSEFMQTNNGETQTFAGNQENSVEKAIRVEKESTNFEEDSANVEEEPANVEEKAANVVKESSNVQEESANIEEEAANVAKKSANVEEESANVEVLSQVNKMHVNENDEQMQGCENYSDTSDTMKEDEVLNHTGENDMNNIGHINKPFLNICTQNESNSDQVQTEGYPDLLVAAMVIFAALLLFNC